MNVAMEGQTSVIKRVVNINGRKSVQFHACFRVAVNWDPFFEKNIRDLKARNKNKPQNDLSRLLFRQNYSIFYFFYFF